MKMNEEVERNVKNGILLLTGIQEFSKDQGKDTNLVAASVLEDLLTLPPLQNLLPTYTELQKPKEEHIWLYKPRKSTKDMAEDPNKLALIVSVPVDENMEVQALLKDVKFGGRKYAVNTDPKNPEMFKHIVVTHGTGLGLRFRKYQHSLSGPSPPAKRNRPSTRDSGSRKKVCLESQKEKDEGSKIVGDGGQEAPHEILQAKTREESDDYIEFLIEHCLDYSDDMKEGPYSFTYLDQEDVLVVDDSRGDVMNQPPQTMKTKQTCSAIEVDCDKVCIDIKSNSDNSNVKKEESFSCAVKSPSPLLARSSSSWTYSKPQTQDFFPGNDRMIINHSHPLSHQRRMCI